MSVFGSREWYREALRAKTGYAESGPAGEARLNLIINLALAHLWGDMPEALLSDTYRFAMETPITTGTMSVHALDPTTMVLSEDGNVIPADGTRDGRWIEFQRDGRWIQRRVLTVFQEIHDGRLADHVVLDEPWDNATDTSLPYRLYMAAYPYPADAQRIRQVVIDPEMASYSKPLSAFPKEMTDLRISAGFRQSGRPDYFGVGPFVQLPAPHYTPSVINSGGGAINYWGYDDTGTEHDYNYTGRRYEPAGTFQYAVAHGWGFREWLHPTRGNGLLMPLYMSALSPVSAALTTAWGQGMAVVTTPNLAHVYGRQSDARYASHGRGGLYKIYFRLRSAGEVPMVVHSEVRGEHVESDSVLYLLGYGPGEETEFHDRGDYGPPDKYMPWKPHHGHQHIIFDKAPSEPHHILLDYVRRPPVLESDPDVANVPYECADAVLNLMAAYVVGERDGALERRSVYYTAYEGEVRRLRALYNTAGFEHGGFGNGVTPGVSCSTRLFTASPIL